MIKSISTMNHIIFITILRTIIIFFFFLNDPPTPEIYPLSLHDALPISQKRPLMQIPDAAVATRRGEPVIESYSSRHKGRAPSIREDGDSMLRDIVPCRQVVRDMPDRHFQIGTADNLLES